MLEEITEDPSPEQMKGEVNNITTIEKGRGRLDVKSRYEDVSKALEYNILKRHKDNEIQSWKSYPGMSKIIDIARDIVENGTKENVVKLANMMKVHENQQSATVVGVGG